MAKKILLIEDDPDQILLYSTQFKLGGLEMITARNGLEGIDQATAKKPEFILIDLVMEGMDGMEVLKRLKKNEKTKAIPAAILTNLNKRNLSDEAEKLGAIGFWAKTEMMPREIVEQVKDILKIK